MAARRYVAERRASFVGRCDALSVLRSAFHDVRGGEARVAVVEGVAGVGKTALVRQLVESAGEVRVVWVSGFDSEALVPYGVSDAMLRMLAAPERDSPLEADDVSGVGGRLLAALSADGRTTIVVVDDAQWVDVPSRHALAFAFRRLDADPVMVVVITRSRVDPSDALVRLADGPRGVMVRLAGLSVSEVEELAAAFGIRLSTIAARRLQAHTGGLPLHVRALIDELDPSTLAATTGPLPAPRSFATLVLQRLAAAPVDAQALVTAAAVLREPMMLSTVACVAGVPDPLAALDAAVAAGLLEHQRTIDRDELRFPHALVRAAVHDALAPARLAALHRTAGDVLDGVEGLEHRAAAMVMPDAAVADALAAAARSEIDKGAAVIAARHLLEAARLTGDAIGACRRRIDALETLVRAGAAADANELLVAVDFRQAGKDELERLLYLRGHLALLNGSLPEAEQLLRSAFDEAAGDAGLRARAATDLAQLCVVGARNEEAAMWAEISVEHSADDPELTHAAAGMLLASLVFSGRPDDALGLLLPESVTAHALATGLFDEIVGRGLVRLWTDDLSGAARDFRAVADVAAGAAPLRVRLLALGYLGETEYRRGHWDDATESCERAVSLAEDAEQVWLLGLLHGLAALPSAARGEWGAARTHLQRGQDAAASIPDVMSHAYLALGATWLGSALSDHDMVLAATDAFAAMDPTRGVLEPGVFSWCAPRVEALAAHGRLAEAEALVEQAEAIARHRNRRSALAAALRARGNLEASRNCLDVAVDAYERSADALDPGTPFDAALVWLHHGTVLRRCGRRRDAGVMLQRAVDGFGLLGATPYAARATAELAACGLKPRRRVPQPPALTPREHAVARLVAEGLTNREIAQRLVLSVKTIEYHLGNSYTKLGVRSRAQLVARLGSAAGADSSPDDAAN